jgi:hypothetical protein
VLLRRVPSSSSPSKGLYNPKAFITHAASLDQGCPHCPRFPTAASRRSLGRVSVPVWLIVLSDQLPITALVGRYPTNQLIGRGPLPRRPTKGATLPPGFTRGDHPVLAAVSRGCPRAWARFPRATHPSATGCRAEARHPVRLACVRRAASVRSEPGSNSQLRPPSPKVGTGDPAQPASHQGRPQKEQGTACPQKGRSKATDDRSQPRRQAPRPRALPKEGARKNKSPRAQPTPTRHLKMPEPAALKPPPTHPFLRSTLSKDQPGTRGYAPQPCSAGKRRLIVAKAPTNKPFLPGIGHINPNN